jgi:putative transposase
MELAKGATVSDVSRKLGVSEQTHYRWKQQYGGGQADQQIRVGLARQHPRYGYRRLTNQLRRGSWKVNGKCVRRIRREEGLKIVRRAKKRRRLGQSKNGVTKLRAE